MISYPSIRVSLCLILTIVLLNRGCFCTRCLHEVSHQVSDPVLEGLLHSFPTEHFADQCMPACSMRPLSKGMAVQSSTLKTLPQWYCTLAATISLSDPDESTYPISSSFTEQIPPLNGYFLPGAISFNHVCMLELKFLMLSTTWVSAAR